jgi:hypothetical protein
VADGAGGVIRPKIKDKDPRQKIKDTRERTKE